jgi:hypothetical protein
MTTHDKPPTARTFATLWRLLLAWCLSITTLLCSLFSIYACAGIIWSARGKETLGDALAGMFVFVFAFPLALVCTIFSIIILGKRESRLARISWFSLLTYPLLFIAFIAVGCCRKSLN